MLSKSKNNYKRLNFLLKSINSLFLFIILNLIKELFIKKLLKLFLYKSANIKFLKLLIIKILYIKTFLLKINILFIILKKYILY